MYTPTSKTLFYVDMRRAHTQRHEQIPEIKQIHSFNESCALRCCCQATKEQHQQQLISAGEPRRRPKQLKTTIQMNRSHHVRQSGRRGRWTRDWDVTVLSCDPRSRWPGPRYLFLRYDERSRNRTLTQEIMAQPAVNWESIYETQITREGHNFSLSSFQDLTWIRIIITLFFFLQFSFGSFVRPWLIEITISP